MNGRGWSVGLLAAVAMGVGWGAEGQERSFEWQSRMSAGQVLEVQGIVGRVSAEYTSGPTAEVIAEKTGRTADFDEVEIRVVEERDGFRICAVYHAHSAPATGCENRHGWDDDRDRRHSIDVEVDYRVRVPEGVEFHGSVVSGDVRAEGLQSDVRASSVDGDVFVSTTGTAWGNTVSGSIDIEMGSTDWQELELRTVSGDITLWLPDAVDTDVDFESLSGDIESDFDITTTRQRSRRWIGSSVEGYIGRQGRRSLSFNTVSGDVRLRRMR